jgi:hypothetical protein
MAPQPAAAAAAAAGTSGGGGEGGEGLPSLLVGFRATAISVIVGLVLGLLTVGILVGIHYSEKTWRFIIIISVVVGIIFVVCMKKLPRAYIFSLLSIAMLMSAVWMGFIADLSPVFKVLAGFLALVAGLFKIYFY